MKTILKSLRALLKGEGQRQTKPVDNTETYNDLPEIPENLFVEKEEPNGGTLPQAKETESELSNFLKFNFHTRGYDDGYRYHSTEIRDNSKRMIRSQFREIIEKMIDRRRASLSQLQQHHVDMLSISSKEGEMVSVRIREFIDEIAKLENEKELSAMDEGMVTKALHMYHGGFIRGVADYNTETLLLGNSGIFKD
jgi:hypothetical protein